MSATRTDTPRDADVVLEALHPLPRARAWASLVVLVGPPGAGKSELARRLAERTPIAVISSDEIRKRLAPALEYSFGENQRVQRAIRAAIGELLHRNISVVLDAPNLTEWERQPLYSIAELHRARLVLVDVTAPTGVVMERLAGGAAPIRDGASGDPQSPRDVHLGHAMRREPITRDHMQVDTSGTAFDQFVTALALDLDEG
ncbi:MAG: ATP-binding protein [Dehalococcoidia bacterium]|nr:ATP-binding protein [Dehalococcoidia bacterium]